MDQYCDHPSHPAFQNRGLETYHKRPAVSTFEIRMRVTEEFTYRVVGDTPEEAKEKLLRCPEDQNLIGYADDDVLEIVSCTQLPPLAKYCEMEVGPEVEKLAQQLHQVLVEAPSAGLIEWETDAPASRDKCRQAALVAYQHMASTGENI